MKDMFKYVQAYLKYGWQPIPVHYAVDGLCSCKRAKFCHTPGKHPIPPGWQKTAFDEIELLHYWEENKDYNIGLVTGVKTNLIVLDVDANRHGYESLRELEEKYGLLPETTTSATGGGGRHYLFQYPVDIFIPNKGNLRPGLDIRGEGGQIVAPPSYHDEGKKRYQWMPGLTPNSIMPVTMPKWLTDIISEQESIWIGTSQSEQETADVYYGGSRNNNLFRMGCRLRVIKDLTSEELSYMLHALNQSKCRPPMSDNEVNVIIGSVLRKDSKHVINPKDDSIKAPSLIHTLPTSAIWTDEETPISYVVPNLLSEGEICLLASPTEAGKSLIAMSLSLSIVAGLPAWGRGDPCPPGRVMYCTEELAGRTIRRRFRKLAKGLGIDPKSINDRNLLIVPQQNLSLATNKRENIDAILLKAQEFKPTLVILDTFVSYFGASEQDADINRAWFAAVPLALRSLTNCAVIIQHHTRKMGKLASGEFVRYGDLSDDQLNNEIRGTSDLAGVAERVWFIWKKSEEANDYGPTVCINFRNTKAREGDKHDPFYLVIADPTDDSTTIQSAIASKGARHTKIENILRDILPNGVKITRLELAKLFSNKGIPKSPAYRWISTFTDQGILILDINKEYSINPSRILVSL